MNIDKKFFDSCQDYGIPVEWIDVLYRYYIHGLEPGGFFTSVLANDLHSAMCRSHLSNSVSAIQSVCKWIMNEAPVESFGSYEKVDSWLSLTNDMRRAICEESRILRSMWEILKDKGIT